MAQGDLMEGRIHRHGELPGTGLPVMFIDSVLPGHLRMNYAIIGDTASEDPSFVPHITAPHKFQIGKFWAPPGNGPGWHTHELHRDVQCRSLNRFTFSGARTRTTQMTWLATPCSGRSTAFPSPRGLWRRF